MASIWQETTQLPTFPALSDNLQTDVLIIGGGMAGLLCAYKLQQAGVKYALVEAKAIGSGITKDTTAKLTAQHGLIYHKLLQKYGAETAWLYYAANQNALAQYRRLSRNIDCDYSTENHFVYATLSRKKLQQELAALQQINVPVQLMEKTGLPFPTAGALRFSDQAQFHPLKFLAAITKGLHIYEHTPVRELADHVATTDCGTITAKKIIVATHFPILNKHGSYFLKQYQHRSYCLALENAASIHGMYVDESVTGLSFRMHKDLLILGGGGHRTGKKGGGWTELEAFAKNHSPNANICCRWATQDCMSLDGIPYIGQYSVRTPDLYVATGFNKWGMTAAMAASDILTDLICGRDNPYAKVFSPSRSILHPQLAVNGFEAITNLLSFSKKRCPHMGCALKWNPQERTWDCPCHGSRFEENGRLIDNPATNDLKS